MPAEVTIWAAADLPGFHRWPAAPPHRAYLADRHRHLFRVTAHVAVGHDDRDTEFHDLYDLICSWWADGGDHPGGRDWGAASCEAIARHLAAWLQRQDVPVAAVEVSEDGQCGAVYTVPGRTPSP